MEAMPNPLEIAKMIDHSLLHPTLTDRELDEGCVVAARRRVATACVKPTHAARAARLLAGSGVAVCAVVGFPHGSATTHLKTLETADLLAQGAGEIDMVVNIGKVVGEDWEYVESDIAAVLGVVRPARALLKVIFENDYLDDARKIRLCRICSDLKVDFVKTSTGYNFVKTGDRTYTYHGATDHDLRLMREHTDATVGVKAAGNIGTLDAVLRVRALGVSRVGTKNTDAILAEAERRRDAMAS